MGETRFSDALEKYGKVVYYGQAPARNRRNHGGGHCDGGGSWLLGGAGHCHTCESDFMDLLMRLLEKGQWSF